jgi:TolB-like protein/class 3 adenylate cyclase
MERRLAAILAADVVGYSGLMESDEAGTFERLKAHRSEIFEPDIKLHHGRIFKLMGDGLLAEFGSVVDAVECAVAVQKAMAKRNDGLAPEKRIDIRIGVNLCDVIVEGKDRHGEGVNIAARLEQLAPPGGICVSQTVIDHLSNKLPIGFEAMGDHQVKNIAKPVAVYRARLDGVPVKRAAPTATKPRWAWAAAMLAVLLLAAGAWYALRPPAGPGVATLTDAKPSLVVLPFANLSDDKEQGYLADGITEDLTTDLARIPGLFVISRNAAFTYKGKATPPAQIAKELGVRYILEGSTRLAGEEMRINAQLIDTQTGGHVWAERFDGQWADIFALQDKVIANVARALELKLVTKERPGGTSNTAAYEAYLRGLELDLHDTAEDNAKAAKLFQQAVSIDPGYGQAYAELAYVHWRAFGFENWEKALGTSRRETFAKLESYLDQALKHPSADGYALAADLLRYEQKYDEAIAGLERAIGLDANSVYALDKMNETLIMAGRPLDGLSYLDAANRVDPQPRKWRIAKAGLARFSLERYAEAAALLEKALAEPGTDDYYNLMPLMACYGHLGQTDKAAELRQKLDDFAAQAGDRSVTGLLARTIFPYKEQSDTDRMLDGLSKAGVPELSFGHDPTSKDRLNGEEIKSLVFGHELRGQRFRDGPASAFVSITDEDGSTSLAAGASPLHGSSSIEGDALCTCMRGVGRYCEAVFRNPSGSFAKRNQFLFIGHWSRFEFSVVK